MSSDPATAGESRLDSWKEIAVHLGREVRTVQRWEKSEGLPVHRHVHGQRGTVYGFRSELDAWLTSRTQSSCETVAPEATPGQTLDNPLGNGRVSVFASPAQILALILCTLVIAILLLRAFGGLAGEGGAGDVDRTRIVVLPIEVQGTAVTREGVGHGLHEELITRLAGLAPERLAVIGRTSSLRYANGGFSISEISAELGVEHVLEGSLHEVDTGLELTLRLVRGPEADHVWSRSFPLTGGLSGQESGRIAREVVGAIGRVLFALDPALTINATTNAAAREAWLRGRYLWHKGTSAGFLASLEHYDEALSEDPGFVAALVGRADAYVLLGRYGSIPPDEAFPKARAAAKQALALDSKSAEALAALAAVQFYYEWDFSAAAETFDKSLALAPGIALTHHLYAHFLSCMGLHAEALVELQQAQAIEPFWTVVAADAGWFYYRARRYEQAAAESRRALQIEPELLGATECLVASLSQLGREEEAWSVMRASLDAQGLLAGIPGTASPSATKALLAVRRWRNERLEMLEAEMYISGHAMVFSLVGLDRRDDLLARLEQAVAERDRIAVLMRVHPSFDRLRGEPRFRALEASVGCPDDPRALLGKD